MSAYQERMGKLMETISHNHGTISNYRESLELGINTLRTALKTETDSQERDLLEIDIEDLEIRLSSTKEDWLDRFIDGDLKGAEEQIRYGHLAGVGPYDNTGVI